MKRVVSTLLLGVVLSACSSEKLIQIDDEVRASLEQKKVDNQSIEVSTDATASYNEEQKWTQVNFDELVKATEDTVYDLSQYGPNATNEVKIFANGSKTYETYVDFFQDEMRPYQVSERFEEETVVKIYQVTDWQWIQQASYEGAYFLDDKLNGTAQVSSSQERVVLQSPLQVGTEWTAYDTYKSQITALYEVVEINGKKYEDIVEVTTKLDNHLLQEYYAKGIGLIATRAIDQKDNRLQAQWQLVEVYPQAQMTEVIAVVEPHTEFGRELNWSEDLLTHQTNETMERAFTKLFQGKKWMTENVVINRLMLDASNVLNVDFSPGIVGAMNAHPMREEGLIPAIVSTLGRYYGVQNVRLTVNGHVLLPDRLPYSADGVWQVSSY